MLDLQSCTFPNLAPCALTQLNTHPVCPFIVSLFFALRDQEEPILSAASKSAEYNLFHITFLEVHNFVSHDSLEQENDLFWFFID